MFPLENIPYKEDRFFTDRKDILGRIRHDFLARQRQEVTFFQALTGSIGIGKTQIALIYAQSSVSAYQACFWLDATTDRSLYESIVSLAELLKLPQQDRVDEQCLYQAIKRWLQSNDRWLLVLDNLTDMAFLDLFIPPHSHGHVLITTLRQTLELFIYPIPVPAMGRRWKADRVLHRSPESVCQAFGTGSDPVGLGVSRPAADLTSTTILVGGLQTGCLGRIEIVSLQHAVQAIGGLRALLDQPVAVRHQSTQLTHCWRWHLHGGNEMSRKPPGQFNRIPLIGLHARSGDQLDCLRMSDDHFCDQRLQLITQQPGIGRRLQHHCIGMGEMDLSPLGKG